VTELIGTFDGLPPLSQATVAAPAMASVLFTRAISPVFFSLT